MQHSSELPVTEWWDPSWDVYDVPGSPAGDWNQPLTPEQVDTWWAAYEHLWNLRWVMCGSAEYRPDFKGRELPSGLGQPGWLGHRDLCPIQWGDPCDCALPPRTTPCVCWYQRWTTGGYLDLVLSTGFLINARCVHHGDAARTPTPPACTCPGLGVHPDCRRHNYDPTEDGPDPAHDHPHNPYDLEDDERC